MALGGLLKNTVCFLCDGTALISGQIGDLENAAVYEQFENLINSFIKNNKFKPQVIICDKHPDYLSTAFADEYRQKNNIPVYKMQHHYAHLLSAMAENGYFKRAIGVIFDGTGYGDDGNIWGGEFIVGDFHRYKRAAYLSYRKLPGGDKASREGYRMGISLLHEFMPESRIKKMYKGKNTELILQMLNKNINSPLTSSSGRIFDAVSSISGICDVSSYEAEAAINLQKAAENYTGNRNKPYSFEIKKDICGTYEIDIIPSIKAIIRDRAKQTREYIAACFHMTMAEIIYKTVKKIAKNENLGTVALSGGVFQNSVLLKQILYLLKKDKFNVLIHKKLTPSDSSISLGQAVYGALNF